MSSLNRVLLIGHVGKDPEIRSFQSGDKVANFSLATTESWKEKDTGEHKEKTVWHKIVVTNQGLLKVIEAYVKKGSRIYVEGQIEERSYNDKDGVTKYVTEIALRPYRGELVLLDSKGSNQADEDRGPPMTGGGVPDDMGDIPFAPFLNFIGG